MSPPNSARRGGARYVPSFGRDDRTTITQLVELPTEDRHTWDAMLFRPHRGDPDRGRLAVVVVHGSVGNYLTGVPRRIAFGLSEAGFTVLSVNTRMANYGVVFGTGLMHRTPLDLDAALAFLRRQRYRRVVLVGFSMGATIVTHYQALRQPPDVVGLCTVAHPASLPAALKLRWDHYGAEPGYGEVAERAAELLGPDPEIGDGDRILVVRRARGPSDAPLDGELWTYRTWWFSRGPRCPHAESRLRVGEVSVPLGIIQAGEDELVRDSEGPLLANLARQGSCPTVDLETITGADHVFTGRDAALLEAVVAWLDERAVTATT